jgi:hypothetical protein
VGRSVSTDLGATHVANDVDPMDAAGVYPDERAAQPGERLRCSVCGDTFVVYEESTQAGLIPDAQAFLRRHGRCLRRTLSNGGTLATPAPTVGRRRA